MDNKTIKKLLDCGTRDDTTLAINFLFQKYPELYNYAKHINGNPKEVKYIAWEDVKHIVDLEITEPYSGVVIPEYCSKTI